MVVSVNDDMINLSTYFVQNRNIQRVDFSLVWINTFFLEVIEVGDDTEAKLYLYVSIVSLTFCPYWKYKDDSEMLQGIGKGQSRLVRWLSAL